MERIEPILPCFHLHFPLHEQAFTAKPLDIGSYCDKTPALPLSMQEAEAKTSRLLDALEKRRNENRQMKTDAISFSSYGKEASDV